MKDEEPTLGLVRFDSAIEFKTWSDTPEGYLKIRGTASAAGVMVYRNHDGSPRRELLTPEELEASAPLLRNVPLVDEHPFELPKGFVDSQTVKNYQVGEVVGASFDAATNKLEVELIVRDARTVAKIKARRLRGLSPGYEVDREPASHTDYEFIQRNRRYNHLALTKAPRNEAAVIHLDSAENAILLPNQTEKPVEDEKDENQPAPGTNKPDGGVNLDSLVGRMDAFVATATAVLTALQAQNTPAPAPAKTAPTDPAHDAVAAEVAAAESRIRALEVAKSLGVDVDRKTESTSAIRRKIVESQLGENFDSTAADGYIDAAFAFVSSQTAKQAASGNSFDALGAAFAGSFPAPSDPKKRSTGFDSVPEFKAVDPTALAHGQGRLNSTTTKNAEEA
jgi:hypothetical protein